MSGWFPCGCCGADCLIDVVGDVPSQVELTFSLSSPFDSCCDDIYNNTTYILSNPKFAISACIMYDTVTTNNPGHPCGSAVEDVGVGLFCKKPATTISCDDPDYGIFVFGYNFIGNATIRFSNFDCGIPNWSALDSDATKDQGGDCVGFNAPGDKAHVTAL